MYLIVSLSVCLCIKTILENGCDHHSDTVVWLKSQVWHHRFVFSLFFLFYLGFFWGEGIEVNWGLADNPPPDHCGSDLSSTGSHAYLRHIQLNCVFYITSILPFFISDFIFMPFEGDVFWEVGMWCMNTVESDIISLLATVFCWGALDPAINLNANGSKPKQNQPLKNKNTP